MDNTLWYRYGSGCITVIECHNIGQTLDPNSQETAETYPSATCTLYIRAYKAKYCTRTCALWPLTLTPHMLGGVGPICWELWGRYGRNGAYLGTWRLFFSVRFSSHLVSHGHVIDLIRWCRWKVGSILVDVNLGAYKNFKKGDKQKPRGDKLMQIYGGCDCLRNSTFFEYFWFLTQPKIEPTTTCKTPLSNRNAE